MSRASFILFTSESVTAGHPDKICDQVSDAVLDAFLAEDPHARVACECAISSGLLWVLGEITAIAVVQVEGVARQTIANLGYDSAAAGFDAWTAGVLVSLKGQSRDIARGVDQAGAGDQGMMFGFASRDTDVLIPLPIVAAHQICRRLDTLRLEGALPYLRPDGKAQVTVAYVNGRPERVDTVVVSTQHGPEVDQDEIRHDVIEQVVKPAIESVRPGLYDVETKYHINPTGRFVVGGPVADAGLTGRKIAVDTYGGMARHGGGAFSGKDPTKVDRSASYYARYAAKNLIASGCADALEIQVSYAIGVADPLALAANSFGTGRVPDSEILRLLKRNFDFRPQAIIEELDLRRPIYLQTARYGHFGRSDIDLPWERLDRAISC